MFLCKLMLQLVHLLSTGMEVNREGKIWSSNYRKLDPALYHIMSDPASAWLENGKWISLFVSFSTLIKNNFQRSNIMKTFNISPYEKVDSLQTICLLLVYDCQLIGFLKRYRNSNISFWLCSSMTFNYEKTSSYSFSLTKCSCFYFYTFCSGDFRHRKLAGK